MPNPKPLHISLQPATYSDVRTLARISVDAMSTDRHTQLKCSGDVPYTSVTGTVSNLLDALEHPDFVHLKAVDDNTEETLGYGSFWFYGFEHDDVPHTDPAQGVGREDVLNSLQAEGKGGKSGQQKHTEKEVRAKALINSLDEWESADMRHWEEVLMPHGSKCIIINGLQVAPAAQGKGVGGTLVKWAADEADRRGVHMWVHSSEGAFRVYEKNGFDVVGTLDVDMDAYAPSPPPDGGDWGRYLIRYMRRLPVLVDHQPGN
jgi:GNAT superfamily N-acetyltransferase